MGSDVKQVKRRVGASVLAAFSALILGASAPMPRGKFIEILPNGTSDGPLPTIWISTEKKQTTHPYQFNDVVDQRLYRDASRFIRAKICGARSVWVDRSIGPPETVIIQEYSQDGALIQSCRSEGGKVNALFAGLDRMFTARGSQSEALAIWSEFLASRR